MTSSEHIGVALVVAMAEDRVIGRGGKLPWRIPSEMQHFRRITMGKPVIMGRKTFSSLKKPLQGRENIVLTQNRDFAPKGAIAVESVEQALKIARDCAAARSAEEIAVIGGAEIYELFFAACGSPLFDPRACQARWRKRFFQKSISMAGLSAKSHFMRASRETTMITPIVMFDRRENKP